MDLTLVSAFLSALLWKNMPQQAPEPTPQTQVVEELQYEVIKSYIGEITAYSSREEETDATPHIAASGHIVYWGMVASNAYPFGTEMRFPDIYGDKIFVVKDRMHARYKSRIDIWFPEYERAIKFGLKNTRVEIIREKRPSDIALK